MNILQDIETTSLNVTIYVMTGLESPAASTGPCMFRDN